MSGLGLPAQVGAVLLKKTATAGGRGSPPRGAVRSGERLALGKDEVRFAEMTGLATREARHV